MKPPKPTRRQASEVAGQWRDRALSAEGMLRTLVFFPGSAEAKEIIRLAHEAYTKRGLTAPAEKIEPVETDGA